MHDHILKEHFKTDATKAAEFIEFAVRTGILATLDATLERLIEMEDRPTDPLEFVIRNLSNGNIELLPSEVIASVKDEFNALQLKVNKLEAQTAKLKKLLSKHEPVEFDEENGKEEEAK